MHACTYKHEDIHAHTDTHTTHTRTPTHSQYRAKNGTPPPRVHTRPRTPTHTHAHTRHAAPAARQGHDVGEPMTRTAVRQTSAAAPPVHAVCPRDRLRRLTPRPLPTAHGPCAWLTPPDAERAFSSARRETVHTRSRAPDRIWALRAWHVIRRRRTWALHTVPLSGQLTLLARSRARSLNSRSGHVTRASPMTATGPSLAPYRIHRPRIAPVLCPARSRIAQASQQASSQYSSSSNRARTVSRTARTARDRSARPRRTRCSATSARSRPHASGRKIDRGGVGRKLPQYGSLATKACNDGMARDV